jgi:hypothetical protein
VRRALYWLYALLRLSKGSLAVKLLLARHSSSPSLHLLPATSTPTIHSLGGVGRADDCTPGHGRPRTGATTSALCNSSTMTDEGAAEVWDVDRLRPTPGTWDRFGAAVTLQSTGTSLAILRLECSMARSWLRRIRAPRKWAGSARGTIRCKSAMT